MISGEATHCLVSALDGKRIQFGIGILTKRICYYPLCLLKRYFLTNDYYSPISSGFNCSGPSIATERVFWAALKKSCRPLS